MTKPAQPITQSREPFTKLQPHTERLLEVASALLAVDRERDCTSMPFGPELIPCPICHGSGRNPEAELVDDDGTCLVCCFPLHPLYAAHHGHVRPIP